MMMILFYVVFAVTRPKQLACSLMPPTPAVGVPNGKDQHHLKYHTMFLPLSIKSSNRPSSCPSIIITILRVEYNGTPLKLAKVVEATTTITMDKVKQCAFPMPDTQTRIIVLPTYLLCWFVLDICRYVFWSSGNFCECMHDGTSFAFTV